MAHFPSGLYTANAVGPALSAIAIAIASNLAPALATGAGHGLDDATITATATVRRILFAVPSRLARSVATDTCAFPPPGPGRTH